MDKKPSWRERRALKLEAGLYRVYDNMAALTRAAQGLDEVGERTSLDIYVDAWTRKLQGRMNDGVIVPRSAKKLIRQFDSIMRDLDDVAPDARQYAAARGMDKLARSSAFRRRGPRVVPDFGIDPDHRLKSAVRLAATRMRRTSDLPPPPFAKVYEEVAKAYTRTYDAGAMQQEGKVIARLGWDGLRQSLRASLGMKDDTVDRIERLSMREVRAAQTAEANLQIRARKDNARAIRKIAKHERKLHGAELQEARKAQRAEQREVRRVEQAVERKTARRQARVDKAHDEAKLEDFRREIDRADRLLTGMVEELPESAKKEIVAARRERSTRPPAVKRAEATRRPEPSRDPSRPAARPAGVAPISDELAAPAAFGFDLRSAAGARAWFDHAGSRLTGANPNGQAEVLKVFKQAAAGLAPGQVLNMRDIADQAFMTQHENMVVPPSVRAAKNGPEYRVAIGLAMIEDALRSSGESLSGPARTQIADCQAQTIAKMSNDIKALPDLGTQQDSAELLKASRSASLS